MPLSPAMSALAARTAAAWRSEQECPRCGDEHPECTPTCTYCSAPAVISSAVGLEGDYSEPNALGQRNYIAPRAESRCEACHEEFARSAKRQQRRDDYEGCCDARRDAQRDGGW